MWRRSDGCELIEYTRLMLEGLRSSLIPRFSRNNSWRVLAGIFSMLLCFQSARAFRSIPPA